MTRKRWAIALTYATVAAAACGHDFEPPDPRARVDGAAARYSAAAFDTISWESAAVLETAGNAVYSERCVRCHGPLGGGQTEYARARGIVVPSLVEQDWPLASVDSLRRLVSIGHENGMPIFSSEGMDPRDIDAVVSYLLDVLRPEVLGRR
jgi:mono/diheme cytochrome c family protein